MKPEIRQLFERGVVLFNRQEFFEAHEVWEDAWRQEEGDLRRFLQGLIQIAAGFVKLHRRQAKGARALLERGVENLANTPLESYGLDRDPFLQSVSAWRGVAERMIASGEYEPGQLTPPALRSPGRPDA